MDQLSCCGKQRNTRFCADCGKPLIVDWDESLKGLVDYLTKERAELREKAKQQKTEGPRLQKEKLVEGMTSWLAELKPLVKARRKKPAKKSTKKR